MLIFVGFFLFLFNHAEAYKHYDTFLPAISSPYTFLFRNKIARQKKYYRSRILCHTYGETAILTSATVKNIFSLG